MYQENRVKYVRSEQIVSPSALSFDQQDIVGQYYAASKSFYCSWNRSKACFLFKNVTCPYPVTSSQKAKRSSGFLKQWEVY